MHYVYILYSASYDKYYVGETKDVKKRLLQHNDPMQTHYTSKYQPWAVCMSIEIENRKEARKLERFIKNQKSRKFIEKLIRNKGEDLFIKSIVLKALEK